MKTGALQFSTDSWMTQVLQLQSLKVSTSSIEDYLNWREHANLKAPYFITIKTDFEELPMSGFRDSQLVFIQKMNQYVWNFKPKSYARDGFVVKFSTDEDITKILRVGSKAFQFSRFHSDKRFSPQLAEKIKSQWLLSNLTSRENCETLVLLDENGEVVGFSSILHYTDRLVIDLIAITPEFRGKGLGRLLVYHSQALSFKKNLPLTVGTQNKNTANALYRSMDFKLVNSSCVWHDIRWDSTSSSSLTESTRLIDS